MKVQQPGRKAGTLVNKAVFSYFTRFVSDKDTERVSGACNLIEFLCNNKANQSQNGSNGTAEGSETATTTERAYSLKRLVRGVGSLQNSSRIGFYTGLVGLLEQLKVRDVECPTVTELFALVKSELTETESGKEDGKETTQLELRIGKILVCGAIIKSGLIESATEEELSMVLKTLKNNMHKMLTPLVYTFLNELVARLDSSKFTKHFWPLFEPLLNVPKEKHTFDTLFFLLLLSTGTHKKLINQKYFQSNFGVGKLLDEGNYPYLASVLFGIETAMGVNHPFYGCLFEHLSKQGALVAFWRDAIVPQLEQPEGSGQSKYFDIIVLRMLISILARLPDYADLPEVLQPAFVKFLLHKLKTRTKYAEDVQNLYEEACIALVECYPKIEDESARLATFRRLIQAPGSVLIEKYAPCKLLQNLLLTLSADSLRSIAGDLKTCVLDEAATASNGERSYAAQMLQRLLSLRQLIGSEQDGEEGSSDEWHRELVRCFLTVGVFYCAADGVTVLKGPKQGKPISEEQAEMMRGLFFHSLEHHHVKLSTEREFLLSIVRHVNKLLQTHGVKSLRSTLTDEQLACWNDMFAKVSKGSDEKKSGKKRASTVAPAGSKCDTVFHILLMYMGLHLFNDPELASSSLVELDCVMKRIEQKPTQRRQSNGKATTPDEEPEWIEVVVDLFLNLLSQNSMLLRKVIGHLFPHLSGELTLPALNQILSVINLKDKSNPLSAPDEDDDSEAEEEVQADEKDDAKDGEAEGENDDDDDDDDDEDDDDEDDEDDDEDDEDDEEDGGIMGDEEEEENITDDMRDAIQTALGPANPETDTESIDLDELDEEQGRRLDEALTAAFFAFRKTKTSRKRKGPTKAEKQMDSAVTHFRMRVLDLIDTYLKHEPDMLHCLELMLYIFEMLPVALREEVKYGPILKRFRQIFGTLVRIKKFKRDATGVGMDQLVQILRDLVEKVAKGVAFPDRNQYLLKACQFIVICSELLESKQGPEQAGQQSGEPNAVDRAFGDLLVEFITNRNPPLALNVFQNLFRMRWNGNWHLAERLFRAGLKVDTVRAIRRIQTLQLLRELLRNRRLINSDPKRSTDALRSICKEALTPYIDQLEASVIDGDRSIGQNELHELLLVLLEVHSLSSQLAADGKKEDKKKQLLKWEKIGEKVQAMRLFVLNSQTMSSYRQLCQRLKLQPIGNEGLSALKENRTNATSAVTKTTTTAIADDEEHLINGGNGEDNDEPVAPKQKKKKKSKDQTKSNGTTVEQDDSAVPVLNGHHDTNGDEHAGDEDDNDQEMTTMAQDTEHTDGQTKRKRKKEKRNHGDDAEEGEGLSKKEKWRRKQSVSQ
uniref:Myb-binding protein 1A n=1 Tax=Anopheles farauti TaxID=69004 RepID=A0A182Q7A1_9DIPT